jgi:hypothetical protein
MSDNFWERDYVIQHLQACPDDHEWLEYFRSTVVNSDLGGLSEFEFGMYWDYRGSGKDHIKALHMALNYDRLCTYCERVRSDDEVYGNTCYECSTEAALRG